MANNTTDCFEMFGETKYLALLVVRNSLSFISCCILLGVIVLIVLFEKYLFMTQRLILYLVFFSFTFYIAQVINFDGHSATDTETSLKYCIAIGFLTEVTVWWELLATTCIMIDISLKAIFKLSTEKLEKFYLTFIAITPFLFTWIPFIRSHYGPAGLYCWIRDRNLDDCSISDFGNWLRFSLYYIPLYIIMGVLILLVVVSLARVQWRKKRWFGNYSPEHQQVEQMIENEIKSLIWYPLIFVFINIVPLIRRIYSVHDDEDTLFYVLTAIQVVVYRFQGILIGCVFAFDRETRKKLKWTEFKASLVRCCCCKRRGAIKEYQVEQGPSDSCHDMNPYSDVSALLNQSTPLKYSVNN